MTVHHRMVPRRAQGVFAAPGVGKTAMTYETFHQLKEAGEVGSMLVVAPLRVATLTWPDERWDPSWMVEPYDFNLEVLHGPKKAAAFKRDADVYVINYEGLPWFLDRVAEDPLLCPDMLVLDESSAIKNSRTNRFKTVRALRALFERIYLLTGSPTPQGYMDLWSQIFMLDGGEALGKYVTHYRRQHFYQTGYGGYTWALLPGAKGQIEASISNLVWRIDKNKADLPPLVVQDIRVALPKKAEAQYAELRKKLALEFKRGIVTVANAAGLTGKLRQVANGAVWLTEGSDDFAVVHNQKMEALDELLTELDHEPLLLLYEFNHDRARIEQHLKRKKIPYQRMGGGKRKDRAALDAWNGKELSVLLAQIQSVSHGLNLQYGGHHVCMFGLTWRLESYEQAYQRLWRSGQKETVYLHRIVAIDTADEDVVESLKLKDRSQRSLLERLLRVQ